MSLLVSIIIPAFNSADTIERSVRSALAQSLVAEQFEVIVVDNGSTDGTPQLLAGLPVRLLTESRRGRSAARNRGAREATGRYLAFLDSDCVAPASWLQDSLRALKRPWIAAVQARIRKHGHAPPPLSFIQGYYHAPFLDTAGLVVSRDAFDQARGFDEELPRNVDIDFTFRLLASGYALAWAAATVIVKYHHLSTKQAFGRGLEGGKAGSQLEAKWHDLVGYKPRSRRYQDRLKSVVKASLRAALDPHPAQLRVTLSEQLGRLVAYTRTEAFGAQVTRHRYDSATRVPELLGARRFLVFDGDRVTVFDAEKERSHQLSAAETSELIAAIDGEPGHDAAALRARFDRTP